MFIPPNWIGLGAFAALGLLNPGFWLIGAGLELGYLYSLVSSRRFQNFVDGLHLSQQKQDWKSKFDRLIRQLEPDDLARYGALENRCRGILQQQSPSEAKTALAAQAEGLQRLLWIFLKLLLTRNGINRVLREAAGGNQRDKTIEERIGALETKLQDRKIGADLRKSLLGQVDILKQRLQKQEEARDKLAFLESELARIQEQAELIREQAVLSTNPNLVSERIDQISQTLGGTTEWIKEQQQLYGSAEEMAEPPPLLENFSKEAP